MKNLFRKTKIKRTFFFLISDIILIFVSFYSAFFIRFEGQIPSQYYPTINYLSIICLFFTLIIFYFFRLYSISWSYVSTKELLSLIKAVLLSFVFTGTFLYFLRETIQIPRSTLVIAFFLMVFLLGGLRFLKRIYIETFRKKTKGKKKILIIGAGDAGEQILRSILNFKDTSYYPLGFVDDNNLKQGESIHGLRVLGRIKDLPELIEKNRVTEIIIAMPSEGTETIKKAVSLSRKAGIENIKILPSVHDIIDSNFLISSIKEVDIGELLQRDSVTINFENIKNFIKGKKILITGAAGSIGSELCRQVLRFNPKELIALDRDETGIFNLIQKENLSYEIADIRDEEKIKDIFKRIKPDLVFHAAAYKHVPLMEKHPEEAVKNNIFGTKIIVEACLENEVEKMVFISTDKAVNPTSFMGASKRIGEMICQSFNGKTKFISVRFGNVLNSRGSVIPIFKEQIEKGGPVKVTHPEMKRYFMLTSEACLLVMEAGSIGNGGEVFVLDMGEPIKIQDLAREMIKLSGLEPDKDIPIVFTQPRPGEKLFEEILTDKERVVSTNYQKIFQAKLDQITKEKIEIYLDKIQKAKDKKTVLKEIIPEYKENN